MSTTGDSPSQGMVRRSAPVAEERPRIPRPVTAPDDEVGFLGPTACAAAGITFRQLDYWARTGLVAPSVRTLRGTDPHRLYSFRDILVLKVVRRLLDTGVSLQSIRTAVEHLRRCRVDELADITLMSDGATVYECQSPDEVVDLFRCGQGVFGIAVGAVWSEVEAMLTQLPSERPSQPTVPKQDNPHDELARRRRSRAG